MCTCTLALSHLHVVTMKCITVGTYIQNHFFLSKQFRVFEIKNANEISRLKNEFQMLRKYNELPEY